MSDLATFTSSRLNKHVTASTQARIALEELYDEEEAAGISQGGGRKNTIDQHAGNILRYRLFAFKTFNLPAALPPGPTSPVLRKFIFYHIHKEHTWGTLAHYMSSLRRFIRLQADLINIAPDFSVINSTRVKAVLAFAQDAMPHEKKIRHPVKPSAIMTFIAPALDALEEHMLTPAWLAAHPPGSPMPWEPLSDEEWLEAHDAWVALHQFKSFIRRGRLTHVHYDPQPLDLTPVTEADLQLLDPSVEWHTSIDEDGHPSVMVVGTKEKNFHARTSSKRYIARHSHSGIDAAGYIMWLERRLDMPAGPLIRRSRSGAAWTAADWTLFLDRWSSRTGMPRQFCGTTGFRRGYAVCLREAGLSEERIQFLGYWFSNVSKKYSGSARMERIRLHSSRTPPAPPRAWGASKDDHSEVSDSD